MESFYTKAQQALQAKFEAENLAAATAATIVHSELEEHERAFIESRDMFFLASVDSRGQPTCSYKGGEPGFVRVVDSQTLAFPLYDGNGMFLSAGNIQEQAKVGLLFIDFETPNRLRVQGSATLSTNATLLDSFVGAELIVEVAIESIFANCPRYVHKRSMTERSQYVPTLNTPTPFAQWKRIDLIQGALTPKDIGKAADYGGTISMDEYLAKLSQGDA
jgi:predicted pyridoxine 5'-phosphate oxidase superfamily flavin-nucleotide-binding protein